MAIIGRVERCLHLRRDGNRCANPTARRSDEEVLLCPKHLYRAHEQFVAMAKAASSSR